MTTLTMKDEKRLDVIQRVYRSELTVGQAALVMGLSERQCYRVKARVSKAELREWFTVTAAARVNARQGEDGKTDLGTSPREVPRLQRLPFDREAQEQESIELSREMVRRTLRAHGIGSPKKRRGIKHRSRRERRPAEGMMLQVDGSPHDWLQGRGPRLCLIGAIDDATSKVMGALFVEAESSWGYLLFSEVFNAHGVPSRSTPTVTRCSGPIGSRR